MNRTLASVLVIASSALLVPNRTTNAQVGAPTDSGFTIMPYFWLSSLTGTVGVGPLATNVDLSFDDIVKHLNFGIMGTGAYRRGHWVAYIDGLYVSLGDETAVAFRGDTGSFSLTQHETMIQPMSGYTVRGPTWAVDVVGGLRYWNLKTALDFDRPRRTTTSSRSVTSDWVDAILGAAAHWTPRAKVDLTIGGDGGGGGSHDTWQAYASGSYDAWKHVSVGAAYRALWVDYDHNNSLFDTTTKGFVIDVAYHF